MYNVELKAMYLRLSCEGRSAGRRPAIEKVFNLFDQVEQEHQSDLGELPRQIVVNKLNELQFVNYYSVYDYIAVVNKYRKWYAEEANTAVVSEAPLDVQADIDFITSIRAHLVTDFKVLLDEFKVADYDFSCGDEAAPTICLSWLGYKITEIRTLKTDCVNLHRRIITDEHGSIVVKEIPQEIFEVLYKYKNTTESYRVLNGRQAVRKLDTGYFIHKMVRGDSKRGGMVDAAQIYSRITAVRNEHRLQTGQECHFANLENVWTSGSFYRLRQLELNGLDISETANHQTIRTVLQTSDSRLHGWLYVYRQYKKAFNLE